MITDFHSVHTVDTSACSSFGGDAGSTDTPFEVRRFSNTRATPNSLHNSNSSIGLGGNGGGEHEYGDFEILVVMEEEEPEDTGNEPYELVPADEQQQQQRGLGITPNNDNNEAELKRRQKALILMILVALILMTMLIAPAVIVGLVFSRNSSSSRSSNNNNNGASSSSSSTATTTTNRPGGEEPPGPTALPPPTIPVDPPEQPIWQETAPPQQSQPPQPPQQVINTTFVVSNREGITNPNQVNRSGLAEAWPIFVRRVINGNDHDRRHLKFLGGRGGRVRSLRIQQQHHRRRRLAMELLEDSAFIPSIVLIDCPTFAEDYLGTVTVSRTDEDENENELICHEVKGVFTLVFNTHHIGSNNNADDDTIQQFAQIMGEAILQAIEWGLLDEILRSMNSPLFTPLGVADASAADGGGGAGAGNNDNNPPSSSSSSNTEQQNYTDMETDGGLLSLYLEFQYDFMNIHEYNSVVMPSHPNQQQQQEKQPQQHRQGLLSEPPTREELAALVCQTQQWLALELHEATNNPMITLEAKSITYNTQTNTLAFAATFDTVDDSALPSRILVYSTLIQQNLTESYIPHYVHNAKSWSANITQNTNYFWYLVDNVDIITAQFVAAAAVDDNTDENENSGSIKSSALSITALPSPLVSRQSKQQQQEGEGIVHLDQVDSCFFGPLANDLEMTFRFGGLNNSNNNKKNAPTSEQIGAAVCPIQAWLTQTFQSKTRNDAIVVTARSIRYDSQNATLTFVADFQTWDMSPLVIEHYYEPGRIYNDTGANLLTEIQNAIPWQKGGSSSNPRNYFEDVESASFTADYVAVQYPMKKIEEASDSSLLEEAICSDPRYGGQFLNMEFRFEFVDNLLPSQGDPTDDQLAALICETQTWLSRAIQKGTGNPAILLEAKDISYDRINNTSSSPGRGPELVLTFAAHIQTWDNSSTPDPQDVVLSMEWSNPFLNATNYLINHVQVADPVDGSRNYFLGVDTFWFNGEFGPALSSGRDYNVALKEVNDCPARPFMHDLHMQFKYTMLPSSSEKEEEEENPKPTKAQLVALVCQTQRWLTTALQNCGDNSAIALQAQKISYNENTTTLAFTGNIESWDKSLMLDEEGVVACLSYATILRPSSEISHRNLNLTTYMLDHVQQAFPGDGNDNYFANVTSTEFSSDFGPGWGRDYVLEDVTCELL